MIIIARCVEKGREKCHQYWPYDTEPVYYGDIQVTIMNIIIIIINIIIIQVTIMNESHFPDWNINEFRVMRGDTVRTIIIIVIVIIIIIIIIRCGPSATSTSPPGQTSGCRSPLRYLSGKLSLSCHIFTPRYL